MGAEFKLVSYGRNLYDQSREMTAIAIWRFDEANTQPFIWAAADSRISDGRLPLIDDGVKLFSLPIVCYGPQGPMVGGQITYSHSLGYAFAGSTLMGQNAYLALAPLLSHLVIVIPNQLPSFEHVASFVCNYLKLAFRDYAAIAAVDAMFEVGIFGFCHVTQQLRVCHLRPMLNPLSGTYDVLTVRSGPMEHGHILCLGEKRQEIEQESREGFATPALPGNPPGRAPTRVIEKYIADQTSPTIAGRLQLGMANLVGFHGLSIGRQPVAGGPGELTYLGRRVWEDLQHVGPAIVALPGMAVP